MIKERKKKIQAVALACGLACSVGVGTALAVREALRTEATTDIWRGERRTGPQWFPRSLQIWDYMNYARTAPESGRMVNDGSPIELEIGYVYVPYSIDITWTSEDLSPEIVSPYDRKWFQYTYNIDSLSYVRWPASISGGTFQNVWNLPNVPYAFAGAWTSVDINMSVYQHGMNFDFDLSKFTSDHSYSIGQNPTNSTLWCYSGYATNTSGPYQFRIYNSEQFFEALEVHLKEMILSITENNGDAYHDGYIIGRQEGNEEGYERGYSEGSSDQGSGVILANLFGAVVGVPISVLNGLNGFAIWNVPIISIIITFLFIGLLLWIVRRFIGG